MTGAVQLDVPATRARALDPEWLTQALAPVSGGVQVTSVDVVEVIRTMATKVRFAVTFAGSDERHSFCLKAFLDVDETAAGGGSTTVKEADFYALIAMHVDVRVPQCIAAIIDREAQQGLIIMRDLIVSGAYFCSALEAFTADDAAASLEQIAQLHAGSHLLDTAPWITQRVAELSRMQHFTPATLQELMDGERSNGLPATVLNAQRLIGAVQALAVRDASRPQFLVHGDAHAGNIYRTTDGPGLIDWQLLQRGGWALDVAYHVAAVLPVAVAEVEERVLLDHYLAVMRGQGCNVPGRDEAWQQYREAAIYGYYLWAITRKVDPPIINLFFNRLGSSAARHDSFGLLGIN